MNLELLQDVVTRSGVQFGTSGARGLVTKMSPDVCYAYTMAFLRSVGRTANTLVVGHDLRPSSPEMAKACIRAANDAGLEVVFVGALPTPAVAYVASTLLAPAIVITGSHIPFDRNGIKFYRADGEISKADEGAMLAAAISVPASRELSPLPGEASGARDAYIRRYTDFFSADALRGMRIAVYEHSSVARDVLREVLERLGAEVLSLGRTDIFVPIDTEAVGREDVERARRWAQEHGFDAILSTDGDGDRPLIGDEHGNWLRGDIVGVLCAQYLGANFVVTPVSSNTALEKSGLFKEVVRTRIGSPYVIEGIEQIKLRNLSQADGDQGAVVGYEANGGFLLGSEAVRQGQRLSALPTRDAVLPILALLSMAKERGCRMSELSSDLPKRFTASNRIQALPTAVSRELIGQLNDDALYATELMGPLSGDVVERNTADGLRITFSNGDIVHLRPSGNAPELRCYVEADSEDRALALCESCLDRVRIATPELNQVA